jgi:peptide/nickel transport system substrate-binding protein
MVSCSVKQLNRREVLKLSALLTGAGISSSTGWADAAQGRLTWAVHFTLAPTLFEPAETPGLITPFMVLYALHDALVKPMPGKTMAPSLAESWSMSSDGLLYGSSCATAFDSTMAMR